MSLLSLSDSWIRREYPDNQILIHEGDEVSRFYYVSRGYVKVYTITEQGEERILLILKHGDIFPLLKNPSQAKHLSLYFYQTMTKAEIHAIDQAQILDKLKSNLDASWELLRYISEFTAALTNRLAQLENKKAEEKLTSLFAYLISVCGKPTKLSAYLLDLKLTHQDIANMIGVTRETVSVSLKKLEKQNKIMHRNGYLLLDDKYAQAP